MPASTVTRLDRPASQRTHCIRSEGVFFRVIVRPGADLILDMGTSAAAAQVRTTYARFTPISLARPWDLPANPRPIAIQSVDTAGDELRIIARNGLFEIIDRVSFHGPYLSVRRRWKCVAPRGLENVALGTSLCAGNNGPAQHITIPNVLYNNNPSASPDRLVPRLTGHVGEALIVEEHRLPIPAVNVEWQDGAQHLSLTLLAMPSNLDDGDSMGVIVRPWGVDLVSLSGIVAFNGVKDQVYGAQNLAMPQTPDAYKSVQPGQVLEKQFYLIFSTDRVEGRGFRSLVHAGWDLLRPQARPCFDLQKTVDLKFNALRGRWRENDPSCRGFICFPEPGQPGNVYDMPSGFLYGWTGQSLRMAHCALEAARRNVPGGDWAYMARAVLDHYVSAPSLPGVGCRLNWQNLIDGSWHGIEGSSGPADFVSSRALGESLTSLADCLLWMQSHNMSIDASWRRALVEGMNFLSSAPMTSDGLFPALFDGPLAERVTTPSAAGITCVMAMLAAGEVMNDRSLIDRAEAMLDRYASMYTSDFRRPFNGATLDAACEDKEAALYYFLANARAFRLTRQQRFADEALLATDWTATFVYHWDVALRPGTIAHREGFATSFWTGVSVQNMHLDCFHAPYEMHELGRDLGDHRLMQMGMGMMQNWTHGIAQTTGHWGYDTRGEQAEQFFQTNYFQGPGDTALWRGGFNPWNPSWVIAMVLDAALKFQNSPAGVSL